MSQRVQRTKEVLRAIHFEAREENLTFMAGSIAYHAFVSLLPLLVLLLLTAESIGSSALVRQVLSVVEGVLTPEGSRLVSESVPRDRASSSVSVLGVAILVWATLRIFRGLDTAFSDIYETEQENPLSDQVTDGLLVFACVALAVIVVAAIRTELEFGAGVVGSALQTAFVVAGLFLVFLPMYYVFPDTDLTLPEVVVGTLFTAVGLTALETLFRFYVSVSSTSESYGLLGGVIVLVTWLYFVGLVILLGAVINAVITNRSLDVDIDPVIGTGRSPDDPDLAETLDDIERRIADGHVVTFDVGGDRVYVPPPAEVRVRDGDEDGETTLELRW